MHAHSTFPLAIMSLAAAGAVGLAVDATRGDVIFAQWNHSSSYSYGVSHVPDFDQRRAELPDNGDVHCVPTACMNWLAYFTTHGDPSMPPGYADWQSQSNYDTATDNLFALGKLMGTAGGGTTGADGISGLRAWLAFSSKQYVAYSYSIGGGWSPTMNSIARQGIQGGYVAPSVGWYDVIDYPTIYRRGGHCMSLVLAIRSGDVKQLNLADPAKADGDFGMQSAFAAELYSVTDEVVYPGGGDVPLVMSKVNGLSTSARRAYLDGLFVIYPGFVLSSYEDPTAFSWTFAHLLWGALVQEPQVFHAPLEHFIVDLTLHADASRVFALAKKIGVQPRLFEIDPLTDEWTEIDVGLEAPSRLLMSRMRDLYLLDGRDVSCIDVDADEPDQIARVTPPLPPVAITSNDMTDQIAVLTEFRLYLYPYSLAGGPEAFTLPDGFPTDFSDGGGFSWDPSRDAYWVATPQDNRLHLLREVDGRLLGESYPHEEIIRPAAVDVDDNGRLYVSTGGRIKEFVLVGERELQLVTDPRYRGVEAGPSLQVARSRTNHDPRVHEGPAWRHVLPDAFGESTPICPADLDGDGVVAFGDILELLASWGPCPIDAFCHADLDYSSAVGFSDVVELLTSWGPCE